MKTNMKKVIIAAAMVLGSLSQVLASPHHAVARHDNGWSNGQPRDSAPGRLAKGEFIDSDGLLCHNTGIASICETPPASMTLHYQNDEGLTCTRTGIVSVCSNF